MISVLGRAAPVSSGRMRWLVLVIALGGCRAVFGIDDDVTIIDELACAMISKAPALDTTRWSVTEPGSAVSIEVGHGLLTIAPVAGRQGYNGVDGPIIDLVDSALELEVIPADPSGVVETMFLVNVDPTNGFGFITSNGILIPRVIRSSVNEDSDTLPWDPAWRRWRIRHLADLVIVRGRRPAESPGYGSRRSHGGFRRLSRVIREADRRCLHRDHTRLRARRRSTASGSCPTRCQLIKRLGVPCGAASPRATSGRSTCRARRRRGPS